MDGFCVCVKYVAPFFWPLCIQRSFSCAGQWRQSCSTRSATQKASKGKEAAGCGRGFAREPKASGETRGMPSPFPPEVLNPTSGPPAPPNPGGPARGTVSFPPAFKINGLAVPELSLWPCQGHTRHLFFCVHKSGIGLCFSARGSLCGLSFFFGTLEVMENFVSCPSLVVLPGPGLSFMAAPGIRGANANPFWCLNCYCFLFFGKTFLK